MYAISVVLGAVTPPYAGNRLALSRKGETRVGKVRIRAYILAAQSRLQLFLTSLNVSTGKGHTHNLLLKSACDSDLGQAFDPTSRHYV